MNTIFGTKHLILLAISIALIIGLFFLSRKLQFKTICKILLYVGIVSEIVKIFYYITANEAELGGVLPKTDLPFQLCSIQIIFILIVNFTKNENIKRVILAFMLPSCLFGGIAAILIPTSSALNSWVITCQYFIYHIAIIIFALKLFASKEYKWNVKDYCHCLVFLLGLMFFAIYINSIVYDGNSKINFMYVVSPPQEGIPFLNEDKGWLVYILRYALLVIVCVTLCYIVPIVRAIKEKFAKKQISNTNNATPDEISIDTTEKENTKGNQKK